MRFALVDNERMEAQPGLKGICPGCSQLVIAKCGERKIHHWAHKRNADCDIWWENETQWHRDWKNNFPKEWQEIVLADPKTGEKHIADVKTEHGVVIEFQHSAIDPQEQRSREDFYKNMIWVVDGTRLKMDYRRLCKWKNDNIDCQETKIKCVYYMLFPEDWLNKSWIESKVLVVFDFGEQEYANTTNGRTQLVWCLLPIRVKGKAIIIKGSKDGLIKNLNQSSQPLPWSIGELIQHINQDSIITKKTEQTIQTQTNKSYSLVAPRRKAPLTIRKHVRTRHRR